MTSIICDVNNINDKKYDKNDVNDKKYDKNNSDNVNSLTSDFVKNGKRPQSEKNLILGTDTPAFGGDGLGNKKTKPLASHGGFI